MALVHAPVAQPAGGPWPELPMQDDERRMVSRQMNGTSEPACGGLWKQGSVGLPSPEESGFPATHPDMCILRVRRNHLLEVSHRC